MHMPKTSPSHLAESKKMETNYYQHQWFTNLRPLAHQAIVPQGSGRKEDRKLFKSKTKNKKNSTIQRNSGANEHPKKSTSNTPCPTQSLPTFFFFLKPVWVFIIPNRVLLPTGPRDGCMLCPGWGRENSRGFFHGFMGPYFMGISYSVVQVIFKAASHPLIPLSSPHLTIGWKRFS